MRIFPFGSFPPPQLIETQTPSYGFLSCGYKCFLQHASHTATILQRTENIRSPIQSSFLFYIIKPTTPQSWYRRILHMASPATTKQAAKLQALCKLHCIWQWCCWLPRARQDTRAGSWLGFQVKRTCVPLQQIQSPVWCFWGILLCAGINTAILRLSRSSILECVQNCNLNPKIEPYCSHYANASFSTWQLFTSIKRSNLLHIILKATKLQKSSPANTGQNPKALHYKQSYSNTELN